MAIQTAPVTTTATTPAQEIRASRKRPRGAGQSSTALDSENSPLDLRDSQVDVVRTPAYVYTFMMDKVPLPATDRVKP